MTSTCTELMRAMPQGSDGPLRESLASLLIRTARENDATPARLLAGKFSSENGSHGFQFTSRALGVSIGQSINGSGDVTRAFVRRAEELTRLDRLQCSTTIAFASFTTINGLLRQQLAWGPEFLNRRTIKYYPLQWALDPVRVCSETKKPLVSLCPHCREPLAMLCGSSDVARCNRCGGALDVTKVGPCAADPVASSIRDLEYEIWVAEQLGEYIRFQITDTLPENFSYTETLRFWMDTFELKVSRASAKQLGASHNAMINWLRDGAIPRLRMTLNLCWVFGVSLLQFLKHEVPRKHSGKLEASIDAGMRHASVSKRRRIDRADLEAQLTSIIRENKFANMPFREICAKKLKRRDLVVRQNFPELSRQISKRYLENRRLDAQVRQEQYCAAIKAYSRRLHARGMVPNHKTLALFVDRPSKLRCEWAIVAMREVRTELGYEDEGEQLLLAV